MKVHRWPRVSFVIALVLASLFETNAHLTFRLHELGRLGLLRRPQLLVLVSLIALTVAWPALRRSMRRRDRRS